MALMIPYDSEETAAENCLEQHRRATIGGETPPLSSLQRHDGSLAASTPHATFFHAIVIWQGVFRAAAEGVRSIYRGKEMRLPATSPLPRK